MSADNYAAAKVFGFVPSYPVGATAIGPDPEPWEFTYVGVHNIRCGADLVVTLSAVPGRCPVGNFEGLSTSGPRVTVGGWAADPDAGGRAIDVHLSVDGAILAVRADGNRPDVGAVTPYGSRHGFAATFALAPGLHTVCAHAINDAPGEEHTLLGCRPVDIRTSRPGRRARPGCGLGDGAPDRRVGGRSRPARLRRSRSTYRSTASSSRCAPSLDRPDVGALTPFGSRHGYTAWVGAARGLHQVCAFAISPDVGEGNSLLGCRIVDTRGVAPLGNLGSVRPLGEGTYRADGWAADPDSPDRVVDVHLSVDGQILVLAAGGFRPDVGAATPYGPRHGFTATFGLAPGVHQVCAFAIGEPGEANSALGCRTLTR